MRFQKHENYYLDKETKLKWSVITFDKMSWQEAIDAPHGWRLPTLVELLSIVNYNLHDPASKLPGISSTYYWSCTNNTYGGDEAWTIDFYTGNGYGCHKTDSYYVRYIKEN